MTSRVIRVCQKECLQLRHLQLRNENTYDMVNRNRFTITSSVHIPTVVNWQQHWLRMYAISTSAVQQKTYTVLWYTKFESIIQVKRKFRPLVDRSIRRWCEPFREICSVDGHSAGRLRRSDEDVDRFRQACMPSPKKPIPWASAELRMPQMTVRKRLGLKRCYLRVVQKLAARDKHLRCGTQIL
jgi:hypothetical protein